MSNHFAKHWDYTLRIKSIFMDAAELPAALETAAMGKRVSEALQSLISRVGPDSDLGYELRECSLDFDDLDGIENDYEARDRFNQALHNLYDVADAGKRVWIA
jgi:hypothetical protein